jgi:hypothetical protein
LGQTLAKLERLDKGTWLRSPHFLVYALLAKDPYNFGATRKSLIRTGKLNPVGIRATVSNSPSHAGAIVQT